MGIGVHEKTMKKLRLDQQATYEIQVQGRLDAGWSDWFDDMTITAESGDDVPAITTLIGLVADQAALQGLIQKLYTLGLPLLQIKRMEANESANGQTNSGDTTRK